MEETGVIAIDSQLVTVLDIIDRDTGPSIRHHYTLIVLALKWREGEGRAGGDAAAVGWYSLGDIESMPVIPSTVALMRSTMG